MIKQHKCDCVLKTNKMDHIIIFCHFNFYTTTEKSLAQTDFNSTKINADPKLNGVVQHFLAKQ